MTLIGASLDRVEPGAVDISIPYRDDFRLCGIFQLYANS